MKGFQERLEAVYGAVCKEVAEIQMDNLKAKRSEQYPVVVNLLLIGTGAPAPLSL